MSKVEAQVWYKGLLSLVLLSAALGLASCGKAPVSTAIVCSTTTSTSSASTTSSTCTDPVTSISITISPATVSVSVVTTQQFQDFLQGGTNNVVIWKVNNITGGNSTVGQIDSNGLYHAPTSVPSPATVSVTAVSFEDQNLSATSNVTIAPAPVVAITSPSAPVTISSGTSNTVSFTATETGGASGSTILWYVAPPGGLGVLGGNSTLGTITANGVYSAPATPPPGQGVTVIAAAQDSPSSTASLGVTITGYSTSSLHGQFAFSLAGSNPSGHFYRAGSFSADGAGNLISVLEDSNTTAGVAGPTLSTGTYTVTADGRGSLQFNDGLSPATFNFVLVNGTQLQIMGFDASGTASGQADAQVVSTFSGVPLSALDGTYIFDFSGVHGAGGLSQIGQFNADGAGNITNGSIDIDDGGTATSFQIFGNKFVCPITPPPSPPPASSYVIGTNGRGVLTLNTINASTCLAGPTLTLNFYVVSQGSAKFVGTDAALQSAGYTSQQDPNASFGLPSLNGALAFLLSGSQAAAPIATAGSFVADGNGHVTAGMLDENLNGTPATSVALVPGTYTVAANGRGTMTFATTRTYTLVFYLGGVGTNASAVVQETDSTIVSDGTFAQQQSAAFTQASLQGNYALETAGTSGASAQVIGGQLSVGGSGTIPAGQIDINTAGTLTAAQAVSGTYSVIAANGRATIALAPGPLNFAAYIVSPSRVYVVGIQAGQLAAGELVRQF